MRIYIDESSNYYKAVKYTLNLISFFTKNGIDFVNSKNEGNLIIDGSDNNSIPLNTDFYNKLKEKDFVSLTSFDKNPIILDKSGREDYLSTIFYMVNCLQEYNIDSAQADEYGRYQYNNSWQKKFGSIENNIVLDYIFLFLEKNNIPKKENFNSKIFVSHDIDTINGSFLQDGFWAIKKGRIDIVLSLIFKEILNKKEWSNIDKIMKLNSEYDIKSTFFWLAKKGIGEKNIKNADYDILKQAHTLNYVNKSGSFNGLHKSCSSTSINEELSFLSGDVKINRHHFLHFNLPELFDKVEASNLHFDSSLGFAERYGFRNGFSMPFIPFNIEKDQAYSFVEMPLMVMDGSFQKYLKVPMEQTAEHAINFFEKHKYNAYLSFLWHNTHFTNYKYKGYKEQYIKIIQYFYESNYEFVSPEDIIKTVLK